MRGLTTSLLPRGGGAVRGGDAPLEDGGVEGLGPRDGVGVEARALGDRHIHVGDIRGHGARPALRTPQKFGRSSF